jgi:hypothetical protein
MKKSIIALFAAATMAAGVNAQEAEGGSGAGGVGAVSGATIATTVVAAGIVAGIANNNSANARVVDEGEETLVCEGDDQLAGDVCVGTTNTVTVTGTGTMTSTITVPVTFTYAPTVQ